MTATAHEWEPENIFTDASPSDEAIQAVIASASPPSNKGFIATESDLMEACKEANSINAAAMLAAVDILTSRSY